MSEVDYISLQKRYGGQYVARRGDNVLLTADTYDKLVDELEGLKPSLSDLTIEYIEPVDTIGVY